VHALLLDMRTGYEISEKDFVRLCRDHRKEMVPLLRAWFQIEIAHENESYRLLDSAGDEVLPIDLHQIIQADAEKQGTIYQVAMNLWR